MIQPYFVFEKFHTLPIVIPSETTTTTTSTTATTTATSITTPTATSIKIALIAYYVQGTLVRSEE